MTAEWTFLKKNDADAEWPRRIGHSPLPPPIRGRSLMDFPLIPMDWTMQVSEGETNVRASHDLILQKMGRNLLLFQKTEHVMKSLLELGRISLSESAPEVRKVSTQTLGQVANIFKESHLGDKGPPATNGSDMLFAFTLEAPDLHEALERMTSDRNWFVHQFSSEFKLDTVENLDAAAIRLDEHHDKYQPLLSRLRDHHRDIREQYKTMIEFLRSKEGKFALFPELRESPLLQRLISIGSSFANEEGWSSLAGACAEIRKDDPSLIEEALRSWETKSVNELMVASQLFELKAEPTVMGGTRILYRVLG